MDIGIICVGKLKEDYWRDACAEYQKRLAPFCRFSIIELPEARLPKNAGDRDIKKALDEEGFRICEHMSGYDWSAAMCIDGDLVTSEGLAAEMSIALVSGKSSLCFVVGSSHGLSPDVAKRVDRRLSMGRMTFPHQLARVMLCEQVYRAFAINSGGKYHK